MGAENPIPEVIVPTPQQVRAQQRVIINAFQLQGQNYLPEQMKSGIEVLDQVGILGSAIKNNAGMAASIAANKLIKQNKTENNLQGKLPNATPDAPPIPGITPLGTSIWTNLVITGESYTDPVTGSNIVIPDYTIYTCLIELSGDKNILKTPVQGRNGTVKDYIATNDWEINIKGGLFGLNGQRPKQDINTLKRALWTANISLGVKAPIFDEWDITNMVVESIRVPETMGGYSFQLFEIKAVSDTNLILNLSGL